MILVILKYCALFLSSLYTSDKILNKNRQPIFVAIYSGILTCTTTLLFSITPQFYIFPAFVIYFIFVKHLIKNSKTSIIVSLLAYSISYTVFTILRFAFSLLLYVIRTQIHFDYATLLIFFSSCFTPICIKQLLSTKRFKSGMPFLLSLGSANAGLRISICIICICIIVHYIPDDNFSYSAISQLLACLLLIPFIVWWRSQLSKSYRQYLREMETKDLQAKVEQLTADNQRLSQIVHKDNKLITAMTTSVLDLVEQAPSYSTEHLLAYSQSIHQELLSLSSHRQESLDLLSGTITGQFHTGHLMLDSILNLENQRAKEHEITLSVDYDARFFHEFFKHLDEEQLSHIIADFLQNAIIATKDFSKKEITVSLVSNPNVPSIQIADTGTPFPPVVLDAMGQEPCSQHLQEGGSGIGLMDIWALKNTARATLLIEEFPDGAAFTKRIHLIFDKKNRFLIMSPRKDDLSSQLHRPDVLLLPSNH